MNNNPNIFMCKLKLPNSLFMPKQYSIYQVGIDVKQTRVVDWLGVSRANVSQVIGRMQKAVY